MRIRPESHAAALGGARDGLPRREGCRKRVVVVGAASLAHAWIQGRSSRRSAPPGRSTSP